MQPIGKRKRREKASISDEKRHTLLMHLTKGVPIVGELVAHNGSAPKTRLSRTKKKMSSKKKGERWKMLCGKKTFPGFEKWEDQGCARRSKKGPIGK